MADSGEMQGFVFSIVFLITFTALISTVPAGLQGAGSSAVDLIPVDPNFLIDFTAGENWTEAAYTALTYEYGPLGGHYWLSFDGGSYITVSRKVLFFGLWLGGLDNANFVSEGGTDRGNQLSFAEIEADSTEGVASYTMTLLESGESAGGFITYYNTTTYDNATHAWDNSALQLLHGVGIETSAATDIGSLLLGLLFFQLPEVPASINVFIAGPIWACIIYLIWFIVKETLPFV